MRIAALTLFTLATSLLSLVEGAGPTAIALVLCMSGAGLIVKKHLAEATATTDEDEISVRVVRWNY